MTNELFEVLANERRRRLLIALANHPSRRIDVAELAEKGCARGGDSDELRIEMHHVHLPKLADTGLVHWDGDDGVVTKGPTFDTTAPVLELLTEQTSLPPRRSHE